MQRLQVFGQLRQGAFLVGFRERVEPLQTLRSFKVEWRGSPPSCEEHGCRPGELESDAGDAEAGVCRSEEGQV